MKNQNVINTVMKKQRQYRVRRYIKTQAFEHGWKKPNKDATQVEQNPSIECGHRNERDVIVTWL